MKKKIRKQYVMRFVPEGYIFAPYIPMVVTPTIDLDDMRKRKGSITQMIVKKFKKGYKILNK